MCDKSGDFAGQSAVQDSHIHVILKYWFGLS